MSNRNIYTDPDQGPYIGDSFPKDLAVFAGIVAAFAIACGLMAWANGWDIPQLLQYLGVK